MRRTRPIPSDRRANRGKLWEAECEASLEQYHRAGSVQCWFRCHPEIKITRSHKGGKVEGFIRGKGPPDVVAVLTGGPVLLAEFKDSQADRFPLAAISEHQAQRFTEWEGPGRTAAVLLRLQGRRYVLPWSAVAPAYKARQEARAAGKRAASGTASLSLADLEALGLACSSGGWLAPLMSWWGAL